MSFTIAEIAEALGTQAFGDQSLRVTRPAAPAAAGVDDLALAMSKDYADALRASTARAAIVWDGADWEDMGLEAAIRVPRARLAMAHLTQAFDPRPAPTGVHPTAVIDPSAHIGADVSIGPFVVLGAQVTIGDGSIVEAHVSVGHGSTLGRNCWLHAGSRVGRNCWFGNGVILQPNASVGADGFSYTTAGLSNEERAYQSMGRTRMEPPEDGYRHRIHSLGGVIFGDDVEVGANSCVDAGTIQPTRVGRGTKIDSIVMVGHNCQIGEDTLLCGQVGVAGSTTIGDRCVLGGKVGTRDHVTIGNDVVLGGGTNLFVDAPDGSFMMGSPALEMPAHRVREKAIRRLPAALDDVAALKKQVPSERAGD
ncbi:UDP-3-O-(3-hydroxymyristoyl)glucosamine N-acyltransferase [Salipiger sp. IMCC34102]|uniref:UDP-3-O-(3-hydroxymyristoyl)glucosamine N-acyltransferase n=1 Tax=Salipiger sp. IMCC34102 TaxID=2510647 RepID=UPI00101C78EB|nr:UDP-3-O-(3-hydroxymyristoyl)glucosamine N-acyltransferase [Salipiger sp. IMCC34102]RYH03444.1 UDP-3-O-(3-hydroxymyristoyl)glucosamine N-acyltransferase [Salipiger sp. IMCC34102]